MATILNKTIWHVKKIQYPFEPTIIGCKAELENGVIGHIDYHLHKDNSWIGYSFTSLKDKNEKIKELKAEGYDYDKITYYQIELYKLENPNATREEILKYWTDYITNLL
jgi:hypothetical protein